MTLGILTFYPVLQSPEVAPTLYGDSVSVPWPLLLMLRYGQIKEPRLVWKAWKRNESRPYHLSICKIICSIETSNTNR